MTSLADKLRNHINEQLDNGFDYSIPSNKNDDLQSFLEKLNKDLPKDKQYTKRKIRGSYSPALDQCLKARGKNPDEVLRKNSNMPRFNSDMNATITPKPQKDSHLETQKTPAQAGAVTVKSGDNVVQLQSMPFDEEATSAVFSGLYISLRMAYPELEELTPEEKKSLGRLWVYCFNKYLTSDKALVLVPLASTIGMFMPKIAKARALKQKKKDGEQIPDTPKKAADQKKSDKVDEDLEKLQDALPKEVQEKPPEEYQLSGGQQWNRPAITKTRPLTDAEKKQFELEKKKNE